MPRHKNRTSFQKGMIPWNKGIIGNKLSEEIKKKISESCIKNGIGKWMKGRKLSLETRKKISESIQGEKSPFWKGDSVGYYALHHWIRKQLGSPNICENKDCHYPKKDRWNRILLKPKRLEWANISKKYKRDSSDWIRLCVSCHRLFDKEKLSLIK